MDVKEAIATAKRYVEDIYADEQVTALTVEEVEYLPSAGNWLITIGFSRAGSAPRTRAQEVLENMGAFTNLKRSEKVVTISDDGAVRSMKNYIPPDAAE
jgi:hypothetical protein